MRYIFDIETDGFLDETTQIHCLVLKDIDTGDVYTDVKANLKRLSGASLLVGHNIIKFDIPAIQKLYPEFKPIGVVRDTLVCTRLIYSDIATSDFRRRGFPTKLIGRHSLEAWGNRLGEYKGDFKGPWDVWTPEMEDYCKQDVEVTHKLWKLIESKSYSPDAIELEHQFAEILARQERRGVPLYSYPIWLKNQRSLIDRASPGSNTTVL